MRAVRFRPFQAIALVLAALAAGCAIAATLAVLGVWNGHLDLLAHFAPVYLAVAVLTALAAIVLHRPRPASLLIVCAVAVVASLVLVAPEFLRSWEPAAATNSPGAVKVIQFNAQRTNRDIGPVADWLIAQNADIITVTEARHDLRDLLLKRAGWNAAGAHGSLIVFTRDSYLRMTRPTLPPGSNLTFVNATYANPSGPIEVVTIHLDWPTRVTAPAQRRDLASVIARLPRNRMILTGDFNATPWSAALRQVDHRLQLTRRDRAVPTYPATLFGQPWPLPILPIDHIYAGPGWRTVQVQRGPWLGSDHYPLIVTLAPASSTD